MTGLLASVRSLHEARIALAAGVDLIDLKEPSEGALGAVPLAVARLVAALPNRPKVSATIGDLPFTPGAVVPAVRAMAATRVDIVKIGIFGGDPAATLAALKPLCAEGIKLVAVMFADRGPDLALLPRLATAGFHGAMLDTADKSAGGLRRHLTERQLRAFVAAALGERLLCGLAGSLAIDDIAPLAALAPDYLGFRGALCARGRADALDPARLDAVRQALRRAASTATAMAGRQRATLSRKPAVVLKIVPASR